MAQRALVTGGAGFIGSHVVDSLVRDGYEVLVVDDLSTGDTDRLADGAKLAQLDITDLAAVNQAFDGFKPEAVFHLAAQASVTASVADPGRDCAVNVGGTLNIVEAARRHAAPLVFTSTGGALYGDAAPLPTSEASCRCPSRPTAPRSSPARPTCAAGRPRTACRTPSCASATSTAPARRRTARRASSRSSATACGRASRARCTATGRRRATTCTCSTSSPRSAQRAARPASTTSARASRPTSPRSMPGSPRRPGSTAEPLLGDLRPGELKRSCLDASRARAELAWEPKIAVADGLASTYESMRRRLPHCRLKSQRR